MPSLFGALRDVFRKLRVSFNAWKVQVIASLRAAWLHAHDVPIAPPLPLSSVRRRSRDHKAIGLGTPLT